MMAAILYLLEHVAPFVALISLIVTVHELGHFYAGRACGAKIDRFSIGFGRALISWRDRHNSEWRIGWLPIGGYVKFAGDENAASVPDQTDLEGLRREVIAREGPGAEQRYLAFKPLWQRAIIIFAGPAANFVLAAVLFAVFFLAFGAPAGSNQISGLVAGGAAQKAGFQSGDQILRVDGKPTPTFDDLRFYVQYRPGVPIDFTIRRKASTIHITAIPDSRTEDSAFGGKQTVGALGVYALAGPPRAVSLPAAVSLGVQKTWDVTATTLFYMGRIVTGHVAADQLHGIVGVAVASGTVTQQAVADAQAARVSWVASVAFVFVQMAGLMSVSVGVLNLLPIPVLDGGHLLAYAYEAVVRKPPAAAVQAFGYRAGLALLAGLMLFANWNDLWRTGVFRFLGG